MNYSTPQTSLSWNWHTYQRLKLALSLGLRRQIFVAVCDDLALRDQLAAQLHSELAYSARSPEVAIPELDPVPTIRSYTRLVSLNLNLSDPSPMTQITQWLTQHPLPDVEGQTMPVPGFQILGIERLTRQPAAVQRLFLSYLQGIDHSLTHLESSLLLWMTRPWFYSIQQSAPEFWTWHTGTFEFVGEPTPTEEKPGQQATIANLDLTNPQLTTPATAPTDTPVVPASISPGSSSATSPLPIPPSPHPQQPTQAVNPQAAPQPSTAIESVASIAARNQRIHNLLVEDLARLSAEEKNSIDPAEAIAAPGPTEPPQPPAGEQPTDALSPQSADAPHASLGTHTASTLDVADDHSAAQVTHHPANHTASSGVGVSSEPTTPPAPLEELSLPSEDIGSQENPSPQVPENTTPPARNSLDNPSNSTTAASPPENPSSSQSVSPGNGNRENTGVAMPPHRSTTQPDNHPHNSANTSTDRNGTRIASQPPASAEQRKPTMVPVVAKASFKPSQAGSPMARGVGDRTYASDSNGHDTSNGNGAKSVTTATSTATALAERPQVDVSKQSPTANAVSSGTPLQTPGQDATACNTACNVESNAREGKAEPISAANAYLQNLLDSTANMQPFQTLRYIEQLHKRQAPPADLAAAYRALGNIYRDRIEQGDQTPPTLNMAIRVYEQALKWLDADERAAVQGNRQNMESAPEGAGAIWAEVLNDLGNLYWMLSRVAIEPEQKLTQMEKSIRIYQVAIAKANTQTMPQLYAMIQNNLGTAYGDLARYRDPAENLQHAVLAYQEALLYRPADADPQKRAATQNNLGTAYWHLAQYEQPVVYLRRAIAAYREALQAYHPEEDGLTYAMVQNNLGTAYWNLSQHEQPLDLLQSAIAAYEIALQYRTAEAMPVAHAATQNNLGTAYWHLANHRKEEPAVYQQCLQQAIAAYLIALNTANRIAPSPLNFDLSATHNNLGLAYYQLAIDKHSRLPAPTRLNHLESALHHHLKAYEGWQHHPDYAQAAFTYLIQTLRAFHSEFGLQGQNQGLSKLPAHLLPQVLARLG